ncbi:MAG: HNH endonuclease, partial [Proteobacteria bacterium]
YSSTTQTEEADLIRNFMFMHVATAKQEEFDREQWEPLEKRFEVIHVKKDGTEEKKLDGKAISAFHRDFLMKGGKYIGPAATFDTFVGRYEVPGFDPELLTLEMEEAVAFYDTIRRLKKHLSPTIDSALQQFSDLYTSTAFPLVLNLLERHSKTTLSESELVECLRLLSGFVFRRYVCGETSRTYGRWFVSACGELKSDPVPNLRAFLVSKHFPDDVTFKARFQTFDLYNSGYPKAVLRWLELTHPDHPTKEPVDLSFKHIQVEHVMPQTLSSWWLAHLGSDAASIHRKWLHTPGNLTLTGYNQEFSNRPFPEKCHGWTTATGSVGVGYDKSNIAITKEIAKDKEWKESQIQARAARLADLAVTIWPDA